MRTIVHLSDLHFGRIEEAILKPLVETIRQLQPDLLAVSGDLTQRAHAWQFKAARAFLDLLPTPQIIVPGNHDISAHNLFTRFLQPLDKYKTYITDDLQPYYADEEIAVIGVNTARSLTFKGGRINQEQIARIRERFHALEDTRTKILVTHHPFDLPAGHEEEDLVGRAALAMHSFAEVGVDLLLAGHLHRFHTGQTATRYQTNGHSALVVQAGTATSTRGRGESNSFNVLHIAHPRITIEQYVWQAENSGFRLSDSATYRHSPQGWTR